MIWPLAYEAGYFQKYGLDFNVEYVQGIPATLASILSHDVDMTIESGSGVVQPQANGQDIVMVLGLLNTAFFRFMGTPPVASIDESPQRTIAIGMPGSPDYYAWKIVADVKGWNMSDLHFVNTGGVEGQLALMKNGGADIIAVTPPNDLLAIQQSGAHLLFDSATLNYPEQNVGGALSRDYLTANRATVLNMAKASVEAVHRWKTDPDFTQQVINKSLPTDNPQYNEAGYSAFVNIFPEEPFPSRDGMLTVMNEVAVQVPQAANLDVDKLIDLSIVQELVDSGFIKQIYGT